MTYMISLLQEKMKQIRNSIFKLFVPLFGKNKYLFRILFARTEAKI